MTNCSLINQELENVFDFSSEMLQKYEGLILYAASCVNSLLKNPDEENDVKIIHLCASKAYYHIETINKDDVSSFKAGDVSYTMDTSSFDRAKELYEEALNSCRDMLKTESISSSPFEFKAV